MKLFKRKDTVEEIEDIYFEISQDVLELKRQVKTINSYLESVKNQLRNMTSRMRDLTNLEIKVTKLNCEHINTTIIEEDGYKLYCTDCYSTIKEISKEDYLAEKILLKKKELDELVQEAKAVAVDSQV